MDRSRRSFAFVAAALVTLTACFGGSGGSSGTAKRSATTLAANDPGCQFIVASEMRRTNPPLIDKAEYLTDVSGIPTVCYDKISFVFDKGDNATALPPGYVITYAKPPFAPGIRSVTETLPDVHAYLLVYILPGSDTDVRKPGSPVLTYKGNLRLILPPAIRHARQVELLRGFPQSSPDPNQAILVWLIGLDAKRPFTADTASSPPRLNVLIMN